MGSKAFSNKIRSYLKNRILVQGSVFVTLKARLRRDKRGGTEFSRCAGLPAWLYALCGSQTGGIHKYFEDLKRGTNKEIGPKDIFEIASSRYLAIALVAGVFLISGCTIKQSVAVSPDTPTPPSPAEEVPEADVSANPRVTAALELTRQGKRFLENGDPDAAIRVLERAVNLNPSSSENYYYLSEAWLMKENAEQAGEFNRLAEEYLEQDPAWVIRIARQRDRIDELEK